MANLDERVANLEAQTDKHALAVEALRTDIADLRVEVRTDIAGIRSDMALRSETAELRREVAAVRDGMAGMATRSDLTELRNEMSRRFEIIDAKVDRHFVWLMGMMVTGFITVIGALVGVVYR